MANTKVTGDLIASGTITAANLVSGTLDGILGTYLSTNSYATQSYVTTAVNNLIDAAPASLDTLNELAAALNDDANFATTVTNALATKLNLSGGNITGNLSVDTNVLFVDTVNDRVGIGTSSPDSKLHLFTNGTTATVLIIEDTQGQAGIRLMAGNASVNRATRIDFLDKKSSDTLPKWTLINDYNQNGTNDFRIVKEDLVSPVLTLLQSGNVGIGTTAPGAKLTVQGDIQTQTFKTFFYGEAGGQTRSILTVATDNTSGVAYLEIIYNRNNSNLRGARKFSALTHWYGSTKGSVQVNADVSVDININPPTVSWSGNVLQITIDTSANGGALIVNASAHYRSGTPFTWS